MTAAQNTLIRRLAEIEKTLKHLRKCASATKTNLFKHPDLPTVLQAKHDIEIALKQLALLPKSQPNIDTLLYSFKMSISREISIEESDTDSITVEQFNQSS